MVSHSSIAQNTLLLTLANFTMRGVSMLFQIYLTGQVGPAGIGLLQLILTVNALAVTVGTSGLRVAAMYLSAEEYGYRRLGGIRQAMQWCIGVGLVLSTLVGLFMAAAAPLLAKHWIQDLRALSSLRLLGFTLPLTCLSAILAGYFTASNQIKKLAAVEICDRIASAILTVFLLRAGPDGDLSHACVSIIGGSALASLGSNAVLLALLVRDFRRCGCHDQTSHMRQRLIRLCVPVALNDYLRSGLGTLEQFLIPYGLSRSSGSSHYRALAAYGTIHGMVFPVILFPSTALYSVADLMVPELARCSAQKNTKRIQFLTRTCLRMGSIYSVLAAGLFYVLADSIGLLLYNSPEAGRYLKWFSPLIPMLYLDCIVDGMHKGLGQQIYCVRVNTLTNLLDVLLLFFLLPRFGIHGYFFTYLCTHAINFSLSLWKLIILTRTAPDLFFMLKAAASTVLCVWYVGHFIPPVDKWDSLLISGGIFLIISGLLLSLTGCWTVDDGQYLRSMFSLPSLHKKR